MAFAESTLDDWSKLGEHAVHGCLYRGQRKASWHLETALERYCNQRSIPLPLRHALEERLCREFKRAFHQYASHVPRKECMLEWMALMQHHGAPTRLLDFTYSIYVGAYFALEYAEAGTDSALWRIDGPWANKASILLLQRAGKTGTAALGRVYNEQDDEVFTGVVLSEPAAPCVCPQTPFLLNERLRIQMGSFMVPGQIDASFENNLRALPEHENSGHVLKIIIPHGLRDTALAHLFDMGLSRRTLFPGLDGYAQSLAVYSPALNPINW